MPDAGLGISPILLIVDSMDSAPQRDRLALQMHHMFMHQGNQCFAFGLILTPSICRVHMFDRAGAVCAPPFNYQEEPLQSCSTISEMASESIEDMGIYNTIWYDGHHIKLRTIVPRIRSLNAHKEDDPHTHISNGRFVWSDPGRPHSKFGRPRQCQTAQDQSGRPDVPGRLFPPSLMHFMIRETWISRPTPEGKEDEASLLKYIHKKDILQGVPQYYHYQEVSISSRTIPFF
ncbi:hypothetical protein M422DRAFT_256457 [Sphaerobolus stellatus SS14]|uniref:Fungal-type protein kinase domain-containing protein n=1 Tax=Sphaerobolus stellatus (strain SS14) TaxID=990650 RepID=A0A0C9UBI0_SPHS4|nr:hypothetical protein M422DRAFT_256457 [Sphaerobolus stellatus SS14]